MIPEIKALDAGSRLLRIPPEMDVPVTPRVMRIVDSEPLRRLSKVSQLGLVSLVYPGAVHSRLEHTLGVYRGCLLVLRHLLGEESVRRLIDASAAEAMVLASLLHDCGHWPFCHPIEDMGLPEVPRHEERVRRILAGPELSRLLDEDWSCTAEQVVGILEGTSETGCGKFLASVLSGPIDIDKMDYLVRDSLHAGVPYGRNFDAGRLISSFCLHPSGEKLAISDKGRTAAEMMVFGRYVMFSEVYWHHAVRSGTAMLQRAVYLLRERLDLAAMLDLDDTQWVSRLRRGAEGTIAEPLVEGLFGSRRRLLKRVAQFNVLDQPQQHQLLAHRPYHVLADASELLAQYLSRKVGMPLGQADVIIDAPPVKLEVDIGIDVVSGRNAQPYAQPNETPNAALNDEPDAGPLRTSSTDRVNWRSLGEVSPVANVLARQQFDGHVKRVRVFVREDVRRKIGFLGDKDLEFALDGAGFDLSSMAVSE